MNIFLQDMEIKWYRKIKMLMIMTPLTIVYLIILDLAYLINALIILPMILIINKICCAKINPDGINNTL